MSPTTYKMSSYNKRPVDIIKSYKEPFFTGYIVCLSNDQGLRYYAITRNTCEVFLNQLKLILSSYYKGKAGYSKYFEVLIGTGVKMEVVEVFQFQMGCYNQTSAALRKFTDNNECLNKKDKKVLDEYKETFKKRTELKKNN